MKTLEQVAASGYFSIGLWRNTIAREGAWSALRERAAKAAGERGLVLADDQPVISKSVLYMRMVDGPDGEPEAAECAAQRAQVVRLVLAVWARPR